MEQSIEENIKEYLANKAKLEAIQESVKSLEEQIKSWMVDNNYKKIEVDGKVISLVQAERRSFDAETLKKLVSSAVFNQVTEPSVKTTLFDAAVSLGKIKTDVAEQVTNKTPYSQLRVK